MNKQIFYQQNAINNINRLFGQFNFFNLIYWFWKFLCIWNRIGSQDISSVIINKSCVKKLPILIDWEFDHKNARRVQIKTLIRIKWTYWNKSSNVKFYIPHWKKKWSHFDLKNWVTGGTKIWPGIPSNWRIFESNWFDIESQIDNLALNIESVFRSKWLHFFFQYLGERIRIRHKYVSKCNHFRFCVLLHECIWNDNLAWF